MERDKRGARVGFDPKGKRPGTLAHARFQRVRPVGDFLCITRHETDYSGKVGWRKERGRRGGGGGGGGGALLNWCQGQVMCQENLLHFFCFPGIHTQISGRTQHARCASRPECSSDWWAAWQHRALVTSYCTMLDSQHWAKQHSSTQAQPLLVSSRRDECTAISAITRLQHLLPLLYVLSKVYRHSGCRVGCVHMWYKGVAAQQYQQCNYCGKQHLAFSSIKD